jgi:twitching motility protein PilU
MDRDQAFKFMKGLLSLMLERDGSDLFITAEFPPAMKIKGIMTPIGKRVLSGEESSALTRCIMNEKQIKELDETLECNFAIAPEGIGRFRCNAFVQRNYEGLVMRTITTDVPTLEKLGLSKVFKDIIMYKNGLVLMVGGTGSGKSTTMAAMINHRNENSRGHIITLEDPIEYVHPHKNCVVMQREIGVDSLSWENALHNTLRQAPDVILLGEIRSRETMDFALECSQTGHLALATLHANNANQALDRVASFFPPEKVKKLFADMSLNLRAVISQRLVRTIDGGRCAAIEIMLNSPLIQDLILAMNVGGIKPIMAKSREIGMQTFDMALFDHYEAGKIDMDTALANADSVNELRLKIKLQSKHSKEGDAFASIMHLGLEKQKGEEDDDASPSHGNHSPGSQSGR